MQFTCILQKSSVNISYSISDLFIFSLVSLVCDFSYYCFILSFMGAWEILIYLFTLCLMFSSYKESFVIRKVLYIRKLCVFVCACMCACVECNIYLIKVLNSVAASPTLLSLNTHCHMLSMPKTLYVLINILTF